MSHYTKILPKGCHLWGLLPGHSQVLLEGIAGTWAPERIHLENLGNPGVMGPYQLLALFLPNQLLTQCDWQAVSSFWLSTDTGFPILFLHLELTTT